MEAVRTIKTKLGRDAEVSEKHIVHLIDGLLGFEDFHDFALVPQGDENPFLLLQSLDEAELAFLTMDPRMFKPEYLPDLPAEDLSALGLKDFSNAVILAIVVIPDDPAKMTANLSGPIVINAETRKGRQVISRSSSHKIRHFILGEPEKVSG